ncbi:hypothetical protein QIS74_03387 [Colletotrichum tabaci]|uniref:Uncharacterized protein n=1 Tax=Colletotrichum tabaci TaxID=1209068 RepID=A0AAV9TNK9_9PEZI
MRRDAADLARTGPLTVSTLQMLRAHTRHLACQQQQQQQQQHIATK